MAALPIPPVPPLAEPSSEHLDTSYQETGGVPILAVSEVFGPTLQGEGPSTGRLAIFLRLAGCNLSCSWCDTPYTWDWTGQNGQRYNPIIESHRRPITDIATHLKQIAGRYQPHIIITGGEPLLQQAAIAKLITLIDLSFDYEPTIEVETNGTQLPKPGIFGAVDQWNVSPKLTHSGDNILARIKPPVLTHFAEVAIISPGKVAFKFVCKDELDVSEVDRYVVSYHIPRSAVWIMPEGRSHEAITIGLRELAAPTIARGYNLSGRMHVAIWGDQRGH